MTRLFVLQIKKIQKIILNVQYYYNFNSLLIECSVKYSIKKHLFIFEIHNFVKMLCNNIEINNLSGCISLFVSWKIVFS